MPLRQEPPPNRADRRRDGRALRRDVPRAAQGEWAPPRGRRDPIDLLIETGRDRIPELLPVRYARMRPTPFTFLRGAAAIMAADLADTPASGLIVQSCGDAHLMNFGVFAAADGSPVFDINDFDETLPAPFEWDLKRLATSLVVAGQVQDMGDKAARALAQSAAHHYRMQMRHLATLSPLRVWASLIDVREAVAGIAAPRLRGRIERRIAAALSEGEQGFGLPAPGPRTMRIADKPPRVFHFPAHELDAHAAFARYLSTVREDQQALLRRYALADIAFKLVGVGSVGTFCAIGLFADGDEDTLLLQLKQAMPSVLEPYAGASRYRDHGQRVVTGQRIMQAGSDPFLGWTNDPATGRHFYVRRLKDQRLADLGPAIEDKALPFYASLCGRALARAHARSGDAAAIAGYLGNSHAFDVAIAGFAMDYARQTERDHAALLAAIESGRIEAREG